MYEDDLIAVFEALAPRRPLFHAEADMQQAVAWELARRHPTAAVRLERPFRLGSTTFRVDAVFRGVGETVAVEFKHWTRRLRTTWDGEEYDLKDHAAHDAASYDFWKDVARLERLVADGVINRGFAVALTNVPRFWQPWSGRDATIDAAFLTCEGRAVSGSLAWGAHAAPGSIRGRESPLELTQTHVPRWRDYSTVEGQPFRYLVVAVAGAPGGETR